MTECTGRLWARFDTPDRAALALGALGTDDDEFCRTRSEGPVLVADLRGSDPMSLLRGADDWLSCLSVAEDVIKTRALDRQDA